MEEVRLQAARIKGELRTHYEEQERKDDEADTLGGRKIAKPKGQIRRFSDVHMAQFRKMDSIANHPSAFRADPSRFSPKGKSLKRTHSKTDIDKPDSGISRAKGGVTATKDDKTEEPATPAKRLKKVEQPCTPVSASGKSGIPTASPSVFLTTKTTLPRPASTQNLEKAAGSMIPSLSRSPSAKSLTGAPNGRTEQPSVPQSEATNKYRRGLSSKIGGVKGILRRPNLRFSNDPVKIAAGTHVPTPKGEERESSKTVATTTPKANNSQSGAPLGTPGSPSHRREKHVNFSASPIEVIKEDADTEHETSGRVDTSPSPVKKAAAAMPANVSATVSYPNLKDASEDSISGTNDNTAAPTKIGNKQTRASVTIMGPSDFTFRATSPIKFVPPQPTTTTTTTTTTNASASPERRPKFVGFAPTAANANATSPSKPADAADAKPKLVPRTPTIRRVRASNDLATSAARTPGGSSQPAVQGVSHGLSNKKRKRDSHERSDAEPSDKENTKAGLSEEQHTAQPSNSPAKKVKVSANKSVTAPTAASSAKKTAQPPASNITTPVKKQTAGTVTPSKSANAAFVGGGASKFGTPSRFGTPMRGTPTRGPGTPQPKSTGKRGAGVLSLSRLSALARPKERK
ncbi:MAG: hypothetical protein M1831_000283 [Alyxoria varia]|nr:MAG: hypothetical protein M1831_000283 [Alyxoria varia]